MATYGFPDCGDPVGWVGREIEGSSGRSPFRRLWGTPAAPRIPGWRSPSAKEYGTPPTIFEIL